MYFHFYKLIFTRLFKIILIAIIVLGSLHCEADNFSLFDDDPNSINLFATLDSIDNGLEIKQHDFASNKKLKPKFFRLDFLKKLNFRRGMLIGSTAGFVGGFLGWITYFGTSVICGPIGIFIAYYKYDMKNETLRSLYGCGGGTIVGLIGGYFFTTLFFEEYMTSF